jgi:hypothetical protein
VAERFFFDGVDVLSNEFSVRMSKENTSPVFPNIADAKVSIGYQTMVAAQEAEDLTVFLFLIKHRFFEHSFSPV